LKQLGVAQKWCQHTTVALFWEEARGSTSGGSKNERS
jgi:hypothetical protein